MADFRLYEFVRAQPIRLGARRPGQPPFWLPCAWCHDAEPILAGMVSQDGTFNTLAVLDLAPPWGRTLALYCGPCWEQIKAAQLQEEQSHG